MLDQANVIKYRYTTLKQQDTAVVLSGKTVHKYIKIQSLGPFGFYAQDTKITESHISSGKKILISFSVEKLRSQEAEITGRVTAILHSHSVQRKLPCMAH